MGEEKSQETIQPLQMVVEDAAGCVDGVCAVGEDDAE